MNTLTLHGSRTGNVHTGLTGTTRPAWWFDNGKPCHPDRGNAHLFTSDIRAELRTAAGLCRRCPFREDCAQWAADNGEKHNVYGGRVLSWPASPIAEDFVATALAADVQNYGHLIAMHVRSGRTNAHIARLLGIGARRVAAVRNHLSDLRDVAS